MKIINSVVRFVFSVVCGCALLCSLCGATTFAQNKRYVDYFLHLYAAELFRTRSFVLNKSWAYVSQNRLERVGMNFSCYKAMTINQSRRLVVDVIDQLVDRINADSEMKARHLVDEPFYADRIRLELKTENIFSENVDTASVRHIHFNGTDIVYETYPLSTLYSGSPSTIYQETFEDALMKLDDPTLFDQPGNPLKKPSTRSLWTGKVYAPESPRFAASGESVRKVPLSERDFSKGPSLSVPQRRLVDKSDFVQGSSTKEQIFPNDTPSGFFQEKGSLPGQIPMTGSFGIISGTPLVFGSSSFDESDDNLFCAKAPVTTVLDGPRTDLSLSAKPCYADYGKWNESLSSYSSDMSTVPSNAWVRFAFYDSLGNTASFPSRDQSSLPGSGFPEAKPYCIHEVREETSALTVEGSKPSLAYAVLSSSPLPVSPKESVRRMDERCLAVSFMAHSPVDLKVDINQSSSLVACRASPKTAERPVAHENCLGSNKRLSLCMAKSSSFQEESQSFFELPQKKAMPVGSFLARTTPIDNPREFFAYKEVPEMKDLPVQEDSMIAQLGPKDEPEESQQEVDSHVASEDSTLALASTPVAHEEEQIAPVSSAPIDEKVELQEASHPSEEEHPLEDSSLAPVATAVSHDEEAQKEPVSPGSLASVDEKQEQEKHVEQLRIMKKSVRSFVAKSASEVVTHPQVGTMDEPKEIALAEEEPIAQ